VAKIVFLLRNTWAGRVLVSLAMALAVGAMAFLIARAIGSVALFWQQQQFLAEVAGALRGGIEGLGQTNLRAVRLEVQRLDAQYLRVSLATGFGAAGITAVAGYVWLELRNKE
jgi:hypothetical protein